MNKYEALANELIDKISEIVEEHYNIKPKNITDDDIENPALINGTIYYDLEREFAEKIEKVVEDREDGFFKIPSMVISRDDLILRFEGRDDFAEKQIEIKNISDEDMQFMAEKMTDMMMDDYWLALDEAYNSLLYYQEKEREKKMENKTMIFTIEQQKQIKECLESCEGAELERTLREITGVE